MYVVVSRPSFQRLFGGLGGSAAGVGVGGLGGVGVGLTKKKVEPQFGVSFGLPYPTGGYPFNTFNGNSPAQNPYFGSISPNGLNLGLVNVNPLVSFQFAKNEYGEKTFKPLVNLHVTPNENIINKVGALFKAKKHGFGGGGGGYGGGAAYNQHYHTHQHFDTSSGPYHHHQHPPQHFESGPPPSPHFNGPTIHHGPPHYGPPISSPPYFENGPSFGSAPIDYYPSGYAGEYGFSNPPFYQDTSYHANTNNNIESSLTPAEETALFGGQNSNNNGSTQTISIDRDAYAGNFANYKQNSVAKTMTNAQSHVQNTQQNQGSAHSVSFPKNRRKRNVNGSGAGASSDDIDTINETIAPKVSRLEKVMFIQVDSMSSIAPDKVHIY